MPAPRQTANYLMRRFQEVGLEPLSRFGQNFLIDLNLLEILVNSGELTPQDVVLEVGTGTGSLTAMMAARAGAIVTVEIDTRLFQLASEQLLEFPNVTMIQQDALKNKNRISPIVIDAVKEQLAKRPGSRFKLVANLPYCIATPLISNFLSTEVIPSLMVVTIQKELADRITAPPSTKDYGALSVWVQAQCEAETLRIISPSVFWPRPQVESAFLRVEYRPEKAARIPDRDYFHRFVRSMFFHRRKILRRELVSALKGQMGKPDVDQLMNELGLPPDARAEQMTPDGMLILCEEIRLRGAKIEL